MDKGGQPKILYTRKRSTKTKKPIFHGAFTGGFSAGYYNTVGSKDGWAPSSAEHIKRKEQSFQDYMDDEDHNDWGGPQRIQNEYSIQKKADHKRQQGNVVTTTAIGNELLRILGWRQSTGQAYVTIQVKNNPNTSDETNDDDDSNIRRISFPSTIALPPLKCDTFGIGYSPPINNEIKPFLLSSSTKKEANYYKMNFDDDPKEENKEDYNFEILDDFSSSDDDNDKSPYPNNTTTTIKNKNKQSFQQSVLSNSLGQWAKVEGGEESNNNFQKKNKTNMISGFIAATNELPEQQRWSGPNVPINYQIQKHKYIQQNTKLNYPYPPQPSRIFQKAPNPMNRQPQQPMAGPTFVSLIDSMKRRFTKSSTIVNYDIQEKESSTQTHSFGCKRYSQTWLPSTLLCKRFSIQSPIMSKNNNKVKKGNVDLSDARSEWKNEDAFFQKEIFDAVKTNRSADNTRKLQEIYHSDIDNNVSFNWEWTNENKRPSMKEKQRIFDSMSIIIDSKMKDSKDNHSELFITKNENENEKRDDLGKKKMQSIKHLSNQMPTDKRNPTLVHNIGHSDQLGEKEHDNDGKSDNAQFVERIYRNEILKKTSTNRPQNESDNINDKRSIKHNDDDSHTSSKSNNSIRSDDKMMLKRKRKRHGKKKHHKHSKSRRKRERHGEKKKSLFKKIE